MIAIKPRNEMTRQELVSFILRQCALLCDPISGHLKSLSPLLEVHDVTLSVWISQGYVPEHQVVKLQKRFGEDNAPLDDLCPVEYRR